jgi:Protein of unknown function with HXXEE motif
MSDMHQGREAGFSYVRSASTRWKFYDPALMRLFPVTYVVHALEEWFAGTAIAVWGVRASRPLDATNFILPNALGLVLMLVGIRLVRRDRRSHWIVPALATAVLLNAAGHLVASVAMRTYSAGLITGVIFWVPLGLLTLMRACDQASTRTLRAGVIVGVCVELVVTLVLRITTAD